MFKFLRRIVWVWVDESAYSFGRWCFGPLGTCKAVTSLCHSVPEKKIVGRKFMEMPMTESVMNQIDKWAKRTVFRMD
jgi:hypothetical protein